MSLLKGVPRYFRALLYLPGTTHSVLIKGGVPHTRDVLTDYSSKGSCYQKAGLDVIILTTSPLTSLDNGLNCPGVAKGLTYYTGFSERPMVVTYRPPITVVEDLDTSLVFTGPIR